MALGRTMVGISKAEDDGASYLVSHGPVRQEATANRQD